ncbi:helix-turn-helix domain-containing protein [Duganella sp. sic0402]|uniref:AraC family transcriptional regulator n=1 Tax=Duganella sp. sic0402 TaxID=2854786 RepID=UPI001C46CB3B|nr:helix-turn-helix domain-containing protein [Duganella sp. sic0402]MBV7538899.1 helix-turn-helix domain-containing protein [Duganella sp. sic0402]
MYYREYSPHPALAAHIACVWAAQAPGGAHVHRVLPDNCVDILWQDNGQSGFAVGMMSAAILVASERPVRTLAVRFKPGMAGAFLHTPMQEITDQRADIDLLWGHSDADRLADALWTSEAPLRARLALIERELLRRLRAASALPAGAATLVQRALATLDDSGGEVRIEALAAALGVSRQHLAAQFRQHVGLSPKLFARICRFRQATAAIKVAPAPDWAQLALACGYFDQSHLIHDFQEFSGSAPERFHFSNQTDA